MDYWFETEERAAHGFHLRFLQLWESPADTGDTLTPKTAVRARATGAAT
jgi:hypothetical protein